MSDRGDESTIVLTDIKSALASAEKEAGQKPAAFLVVGGELNGTLFDLEGDSVTSGRNADNDIPLEFSGISRYHFKMQLSHPQGWSIEDCGSKNGTYVNNIRISKPINLKKGDIVKIGSIALKFLPKGDPERLTYDKLHREAITDQFTGCFNKTYFNEKISLEVKKSKITGKPLSLIIFDIDHFKKLNDSHGHDAGDAILKQLAMLVRQNGVRDLDIFARYGGEEFVILLPQTQLKQAFEIAERLRALVEKHPFKYEESDLPITISMGVADYRQGVVSGTDLFKRADQAVYKAKEGGRNQVQFYRA